MPEPLLVLLFQQVSRLRSSRLQLSKKMPLKAKEVDDVTGTEEQWAVCPKTSGALRTKEPF